MLNAIWGFFIVIGIVVAVFTGRMEEVSTAALTSSKEAITLCLTMLGIMSMWTGLMKIAENSGLIELLTQKMTPLLRYLFPDVPKNSKALQYISTNIIANVFGLGFAATPAGLKAMEELQILNDGGSVASKSMCMFLIVNMSSLQLVTMNIIAYRSQFGSLNPSEIIAPGVIATVVTTIAGVMFAKICERRYFT